MKKSVLITGASSGIGFTTACLLQNSGYQVYGCVRRRGDMKRLCAEAPGLKGVLLDVTKPKQIAQVLAELSGEFDAASELSLVNNAGIAVAGPIEAIAMDELRKQFDVNVFGLVEVTQAFLPWVRRTKGRIINISSVAGLSSTPFLGAYSSSKYAVESLSDALRRELAPFGVKVIVIEPGPIATPIWEKGLGNEEMIKAALNQDRLQFYTGAFDKFRALVTKSAENAIPVERVAQAILTSLKAKSPPVRQIVAGRGDHFGALMARVMPAKFIDFAVGRVLN